MNQSSESVERKKGGHGDTNLGFDVTRVYLKSSEFEVPNAPMVFEEKLEIVPNLEFRVKHEEVREGIYDVVLRIMLTAKNGDHTAYTAKIEYAGVFTVQNASKEERDFLLNAHAADVLFGYARAELSRMVVNGNFPPVVLRPMQFVALYQQQLKQQKEAESKGNGAAKEEEIAPLAALNSEVAEEVVLN